MDLISPSIDLVFGLATGPVESSSPLLKEELLYSETLSGHKKRLFLLGRRAVRDALIKLASKEWPPILQAEGGEPLWPSEVTGSISHTKDLAISVVGYTTKWRSLGVDIEDSQRAIIDGLEKRIASPIEMEWIVKSEYGIKLATLLLFSLKESTFKAVYPLCKVRFGFKDAYVSPPNRERISSIEILRDLGDVLRKGTKISGYFMQTDGFLITVVTIPNN